MKKSFIKVFMLFVVLSLLITGCNNSKNTQDTTQSSQTDTVQKDNKDTADKSASDKSSGSPSKKTLAQAVNKDIESFTSKYVDMYNQEGNAFVKVVFEDLSFLPEEVVDNAEMFYVGEEEAIKYYSLFINLEDDVLYRISALNYETYDESMVGSVYLSKGDCFIIASNDEGIAKTVNIKAFNMNNSTFAENYIYNTLEYGSPHYVAIWKNENQKLTNNVYRKDMGDGVYLYETNEFIDLDGDGDEERLYYSILNDLNEESENAHRYIAKALFIDDKEYDLIKLGEVGGYFEEHLGPEIADIEIIDIDKEDGYKEILLKRWSNFSGEEITKVFHYKDGQLEEIGMLETLYPIEYSNLINDGKLVMKAEGYDFFFIYLYDEIYSLKNGKLEKEEKKDIVDIYTDEGRLTAILKEDLNLYEKPDSKEAMEVLEKGDILLFLEAGENWIKVKSFNTGKTGYIIFEVDEENLKFKDQEHLNEIGIHGVFHGLYT